jgi:hypothetical protein
MSAANKKVVVIVGREQDSCVGALDKKVLVGRIVLLVQITEREGEASHLTIKCRKNGHDIAAVEQRLLVDQVR